MSVQCSRSSLIEHVKRRALLTLAQFERKLDPLRLAPGERGRRLAQLEVPESDRIEGLQLVHHAGDISKQLDRLAHGQVEDVGDRQAVKQDLERLAVKRRPPQLGQGA